MRADMQARARVLCFALIALVNCPLSAASIRLASSLNEVVIPEPAGYVSADLQWEPVRRVASVVGSDNEYLAMFLQPEEARSIAAGGPGEFTRVAYVQRYKAAKGRFFNRHEFEQIVRATTAELPKASIQLEAELPKLAERHASAHGERVSYKKPTILPPFYEGPEALMMSSIGAIEAAEGSEHVDHHFATSWAMIRVRGNLLFLYVTDDQKNLEATRTAVRAWSDQVLAANPLTWGEQVRSSLPVASATGRIDWWKVGGAATRGAGIALLIVVLSRVWKRLTSRKA